MATKSISATQLPPERILQGDANWRTFQFHLPGLLDLAGLWDNDKGVPNALCKAYHIIQNVCPSISSAMEDLEKDQLTAPLL